MFYQEVIAGITGIDSGNSEEIWKYFNDHDGIPIKSEFETIYNNRLNNNQKIQFMTALQQLVKADELDDPVRKKNFELLAKAYDCIFLWLEDGAPGTMP